MGVSWGLTERVKFSACGLLADWVAPDVAAVYSVTYKQDPTKRPKAHTVLYFGESAKLSQERLSLEMVFREIPHIGIGPEEAFIFIHPMPGSSTFERAALVKSLIGDYRPPGNGY